MGKLNLQSRSKAEGGLQTLMSRLIAMMPKATRLLSFTQKAINR